VAVAAKKSARTRARSAAPKPRSPIRRFDVFAEVQRLSAIKDGLPAAQAKGYGLWLAKLVAARRFRKQEPSSDSKERAEPRRKTKWRSLSGQPQTDKLFDREIVARMGVTFYRRVFAPAIRAAVQTGQDYMEIRDSIRKQWKVEAP
jgi:hypothetical protein